PHRMNAPRAGGSHWQATSHDENSSPRFSAARLHGLSRARWRLAGIALKACRETSFCVHADSDMRGSQLLLFFAFFAFITLLAFLLLPSSSRSWPSFSFSDERVRRSSGLPHRPTSWYPGY